MSNKAGQPRLAEAIRRHWRQLLPMWICFPLFFLFVEILNRLAVPDVVSLPLLAATMFPYFFWSFGRAWGLAMNGRISIPMGMLLVFVPPLPLAVAMGYFLNVILPSLLR